MSANFSWTPEGKDFMNRLKALSSPQQVPLAKLFTPGFMQQHTQYTSFEAMLRASDFKVETAEDFLVIPEAEWEHFIQQHTSFPSWQAMQQVAAAEWAKKQL
jgi:hypothetical protein